MNINKITAVCAIGSALLLAACGKKEPGATGMPDVRVTTISVEPASSTTSRSYSGTVEESGGAALSFAAAGTIQSVNVSEGDRVAAGQVIATLNRATLQNSYDIAHASLMQAQDAYDRFKKLHDANSLPDMQWVQVEQALSQARSAEAIAAKALQDGTLRAPKAGYVSEKLLDAGMNAAPGIPVVKIVQINPVKVNIAVTEETVAQMPAGAEATITVASMPGTTFRGRLAEKSVEANPLTRTYDVKFTVDNPRSELLPGMLCEVTPDGSAGTQRTAVMLPPQTVLLDAANRNFVWIDSAGTARKRIVATDGMTAGGIVVTSGLNRGDKVIATGLQKVSEGTHVIDINAPAPVAK